MITLLDYGAGNVRSVINAIESLGERVTLVSGPDDILSAEKLIFPGVGNYGHLILFIRHTRILDKTGVNCNGFGSFFQFLSFFNF
jgi:glutamine amidotransferase/cyclase